MVQFWEGGDHLEIKKYKFYLSFKGGHSLVLETDTDIRKAKREYANGGEFIITENNYTINLAQIERIQVRTQL